MGNQSWDDIDLAGLSMEEPNKPSQDDNEKRKTDRIKKKDLKQLVEDLNKNLSVDIYNVSTSKFFKGSVEDISCSGIQTTVEAEVKEKDILQLQFSIGQHLIKIKGEVVWIDSGMEGKKMGIKFINPDEKEVNFINSLFSALHFISVFKTAG